VVFCGAARLTPGGRCGAPPSNPIEKQEGRLVNYSLISSNKRYCKLIIVIIVFKAIGTGDQLLEWPDIFAR
jgi:hypothetical protein